MNLGLIRCFSVLSVLAALLGVTFPVSDSDAEPFGVAVHIPNDSQLDLASDLGVDWIRVDFIWAFVEPEQDDFYWDRYDQLVAEAEERDLKIFATIAGTPDWATSGGEGPGVPDEWADWSDICYRAAARYRGRVHAWGMWNEPNLGKFWEGTLQEYLSIILRRGAQSVHSADRNALVGGPELAHLSSANWDDWLATCIEGAIEELDVVTHHVYPSGVGAANVTRKLEIGGSFPWDPPSVRKVLRDTGWFGRPFWLTETGVETDTGGPWAQALFYDDLLGEWFPNDGEAKWIDRLFFYQLFDDPGYPELTFGVAGPPPEMEIKLAFDHYQGFIEEAIVDDARVQSFVAPEVVTPGQWNETVVEIVNEGTTTWRVEDGFSVGIDGLPEDWQIDAGLIAEGGEVAPGSVTQVNVLMWPPWVGWEVVNHRYDLRVRMVKSDGLGLGSPLRADVVSGWRSLPEFIRQPMTNVVNPGGDAVFRVVVDGEQDLDYSWYHNGRFLIDGAEVSGSDSSALTVHVADVADTGEYVCQVTSIAGWTMSERAELILTDDGRGGPRQGEGRSPDGNGPSLSFERFFEDAARRREEALR